VDQIYDIKKQEINGLKDELTALQTHYTQTLERTEACIGQSNANLSDSKESLENKFIAWKESFEVKFNERLEESLTTKDNIKTLLQKVSHNLTSIDSLMSNNDKTQIVRQASGLKSVTNELLEVQNEV
jgi:hypothetical protein